MSLARVAVDSQYVEAEGEWRREKIALENKRTLLKTRVDILREMVGLAGLPGFTEGKEPEVFVRGFLEGKKREWPQEKKA